MIIPLIYTQSCVAWANILRASKTLFAIRIGVAFNAIGTAVFASIKRLVILELSFAFKTTRHLVNKRIHNRSPSGCGETRLLSDVTLNARITKLFSIRVHVKLLVIAAHFMRAFAASKAVDMVVFLLKQQIGCAGQDEFRTPAAHFAVQFIVAIGAMSILGLVFVKRLSAAKFFLARMTFFNSRIFIKTKFLSV